MLHEWLKSQKCLPLGSQKFMNGYLDICSDGFNFLRLSQMMPKIIEYFFFMFIVNVTWICQTKKIVTFGLSKIYKCILRDTYRWVKVSKSLTDGGQNYWGIFFKIIVNVTWMTLSQKIFTFGVSKIYKWILKHMFRWIQLSKAVTNNA